MTDPSLAASGGAAMQVDLVDALSQSAFVVMGVLTKIAADNDLSLTQLRVLAILRDRCLRMTDLVDYLGLEKSSLTGLVSRAERRGLIARSPHPNDKRAVEVHLTDAGRALAERLSVESVHRLQPMVAALAPAQQRALNDLLTTTLTP